MILRRIARPMLGATFIFGGINALRYHEQHAQAAEPLLERTVRKQSEKLPDSTPTDAESLVRIDAAVKIAAGTTLALGVFPRVSAALLFGGLIPTTAAGHPFWEEEDPAARQQQLTQFLKNAGMAGGLLLAVVDTEGHPSLSWRARHAAQLTGKQMKGARNTAQGNVRAVRGNVRAAGESVRSGGGAMKSARSGVREAQEKARKTQRASAQRMARAKGKARHASERRVKQAKRASRSCG